MKLFILWMTMVLTCAALGQESPKNRSRAFSAPTYYIVIEGQNWDQEGDLVKFRGASNLPPGARIMLVVSAFNDDAWRDFSGNVCATLSKEGFFNGDIHPKKGMRFRKNLLLQADFATYRCQQPADVLSIVGKKGEHLGEKDAPFGELIGVSHNPQLYHVSGWYYGIRTIARIV